MEFDKLLNHDLENPFSKKRFLDRLFSRNLLEKNQNKNLSDIKFFTMMDYKIAAPTIEDIDHQIESLRVTKGMESIEYSIHPDDTPSQIMLRFAEEFLFILKTQKNKVEPSYMPLSNKIAANPDLIDAIIQDDKKSAQNFFNKNPDFFDGITNRLKSYDPLAKTFLDEAWEKVYDDNYKEALTLIDRGIKFNDKVYNPHLYELKSTCLLEKDRPDEALININIAIELLILDLFDFDENIASFLLTRSSIKRKTNNIEGSEKDEETANKYNSLWKESN